MDSKHRALIVDDQPDIRKLTQMTMELGNFELYETDNGADALRLARQLRPAVMLLDVMLPGGLDGYQVCEQIKADALLREAIKVILVTARGQRTDIERGHAAGCDAYLVKPFSPMDLLATATRLVAC